MKIYALSRIRTSDRINQESWVLDRTELGFIRYYDDQIRDEMGRVCSMYVGDQKYCWSFVYKNPAHRTHKQKFIFTYKFNYTTK
jgi:hypothetical protein